MNVSTTIKKLGIEQAFKYLYKEPEKNLVKLIDWADKFTKGEFETQRKMVRHGDVDPCVFIHYSNANIRECTLLEALKSPIFMAYHDNQPFNDNMLRPCPMLENPEFLRKMVEETGAHSTDPQSPETADHLCSKCDAYAACWKTEADRLWAENRAEKEEQK